MPLTGARGEVIEVREKRIIRLEQLQILCEYFRNGNVKSVFSHILVLDDAIRRINL